MHHELLYIFYDWLKTDETEIMEAMIVQVSNKCKYNMVETQDIKTQNL